MYVSPTVLGVPIYVEQSEIVFLLPLCFAEKQLNIEVIVNLP